MSGEDFDAFASMGGMQMNNQEDAFAEAGFPSDMNNNNFGGDFSQGFGDSSSAPMSAPKSEDYTEEELQLLAQVE